ncbi:TetR/AcrR family transcriptional regulator [Desulfatiglans anilini]|uniref:TetR/AcrR family transcriptional regulator n=1 Tax=Desulfatiglans anilini TaxID=90728 RepID=UPI000486D592|nr:TetR/AcrR family transcriptional regulator [Desulfatiglans anilini]
MRISKTKQDIVEKATDLFYEHGFVKASIRDIVKAVGITNSTVYIHFKNKDEILYYIIENIGSTLLSELNEGMKNHDNLIECLREMVYRQVCLIKEKRKEIKIYMEEQYQLPPSLRGKALKQHREIYNIYYTLLCKMNKMGFLRDIDNTVMTFAVFAMMNWSYRWFDENGRLSIEEIADSIIRIFFEGIFKEGILEKR